MRKTRLGSSDLYITPIGLGTWAIGGGGWAGGWGPQTDEDSIATIHRALDLGINWIDIAPYYGLGHSEELVGQAIAGRRDRVILATKCGLVWEPGSTTVSRRLSAQSVRCEVESSLRRLKTDVIDLYQIHWPTDSETETAEGWGTVGDLIREGKVRYAGVSNFTLAQHQRAHKIRSITSSQPSYNMILRADEAEVLPYCATNAIGVIVARPMAGGLLTGRFTRERATQLPDDDWRKRKSWFQEPELAANLELVEALRAVAERNRATVAQIALAWVLRRPEVTAVIAGARNPWQIEEDVLAGELQLSADDLAAIESMLASWQETLNRHSSAS